MAIVWQINGRSDLSWEESVRFDLYYVENASPISDLMILWRTARAWPGRFSALQALTDHRPQGRSLALISLICYSFLSPS